ncbi:hypothetical protein GE21DRAFT_1310931 [Neurospora crassa]|nr:hypothetical protein GE21DRAFT_1310931 [Neurospora crassa]
MTTAPAVELVGLFSPNNASLNDVDLIGQRPSSPPPPPPCPSAKYVVLGCPTRTYIPALTDSQNILIPETDRDELRASVRNHIFTTRTLLSRFPEPSAPLDETEASIIQVSCRASILVDTGGNGDMEASMCPHQGKPSEKKTPGS